jgi:hypothetical protein
LPTAISDIVAAVKQRYYYCLHCEYYWVPRVRYPKRCPNCAYKIDYGEQIFSLRLKDENNAAAAEPTAASENTSSSTTEKQEVS